MVKSGPAAILPLQVSDDRPYLTKTLRSEITGIVFGQFWFLANFVIYLRQLN
jgi:hypothetical protein